MNFAASRALGNGREEGTAAPERGRQHSSDSGWSGLQLQLTAKSFIERLQPTFRNLEIVYLILFSREK